MIASFVPVLSLLFSNLTINVNIIIDDRFITYGILSEKLLLVRNNEIKDSIDIRFIPGEIVLDSIQARRLQSFKGDKYLKFSYQDPSNHLLISNYRIKLEESFVEDEYSIYYIHNMYNKKNKRKFNSKKSYVCEFKNQSWERREVPVKK